MIKKQTGFTVVEILLVVITIAALSLVGWTMYQSNTADEQAREREQTRKETTRTETAETEESAIPDDWTTYRDQDAGFSFAYPREWGEIEIKRKQGSSGKMYLASFEDKAAVSFSGATLDYRAQRGGGVFTGKNKGWEKESAEYYFIRNYSDDRYRSKAENVTELKAGNTTGLYKTEKEPFVVEDPADVHTVSFNVPVGLYRGVAFAYEVSKERERQDTASGVAEFKDVVKTMETL